MKGGLHSHTDGLWESQHESLTPQAAEAPGTDSECDAPQTGDTSTRNPGWARLALWAPQNRMLAPSLQTEMFVTSLYEVEERKE